MVHIHIHLLLVYQQVLAGSILCVGNTAPPNPTIPLSKIIDNNSSFCSSCQLGLEETLGSILFSPSFSITIAGRYFWIIGWISSFISKTLPETDECIFADINPSEEAILLPT